MSDHVLSGRGVSRSAAALTALVLGAYLTGCAAPEQAPSAASGELNDPTLRAQLQGSGGGSEAHPGAALYAQHCAACHEQAVARAPARNILEMLAPETMLTALEQGVMQQQAAALSAAQRAAVVEYLVGKPDTAPVALQRCAADPDWFDWDEPPSASGWGFDANNTRSVPPDVAGLDATDLADLEIKWVFDYPRSTRARSQPALAGSALIVGSQNGSVYALDRRSGCVRWVYSAGAEVRTGTTIPAWSNAGERRAIGYFSDILARVHAVDLTNGTPLWRTLVDEHHNATATAQPVYFEGRIIQSVSSLEVVPAADPAYPCCSFRGAVVTLDAANGAILHKTHTIDEAPAEVGRNNIGTPILAPSGAPVWNSPTLDRTLRRRNFGTGENYSSPANDRSDAIIAVDLDSGRIVWVRQTTSRDAWNLACMPFIDNQTNCPLEKGPDLDFGAPPILVEDGARRVLVAGQKSGAVFGIDPRDGRLLWQRKVGRGGVQGGMHFGMAADGNLVYVPISDYTDESLSAADARPGMYALDAFSGEVLWAHPAPDVCGDLADCDAGISAAVSAIPGAVLAGHMDGRLRAYARSDGRLLWELNTLRKFTTLAGREASGGSFGGGSGPVAYDGMLYVNSGYGLYFHMPGNVLIALGRKDPQQAAASPSARDAQAEAKVRTAAAR